MNLSPEEWTTIFLSLRVALLATLICLPVGLGLAWLLARKDFWGKSLLNSLIHLAARFAPRRDGLFAAHSLWKKRRDWRLP